MAAAEGSLRRRAVLAMAVSAIGCAGAAKADIPGDWADLKVVDRETGQVLPSWRHDGRLFVAGQPGARYSLRVTNHTDGRILVVMSVDGVNVVTGETAGYGQKGYVFAPHQSYDVSGWRKSETEVAAFTFAPQGRSYPAQTGRPVDIGVIGIAAFKERVAVVTPVAPAVEARPESRGASSRVEELVVPRPGALPVPPAPRASARMAPAPSEVVITAERTEKLGTGHGAREWSVSTIVSFQRATVYPRLIRQVEYDTRDNLVARGIIRSVEDGPAPHAFPGSPRGFSYVPDPPGGF